jgi:hypothetical protein
MAGLFKSKIPISAWQDAGKDRGTKINKPRGLSTPLGPV